MRIDVLMSEKAALNHEIPIPYEKRTIKQTKEELEAAYKMMQDIFSDDEE
jgi:hypothetical protein